MSLLTLDSLVSLVTLTVLEVVLGVDNIIFVAILVGKLPSRHREAARRLGLALALVLRILLLSAITWIAGLTQPIFTVRDFGVSGRDIILLAGGLFLIAKSTNEIHDKLEGEEAPSSERWAGSFRGAILQIALLDLVFSLDSVITAVGMAQQLPIMIAAVVIAMGIMLVAAPHIGAFIDRHPSVKILALAFLMMVGLVLAADGLHFHVPKGYVYFAMAFSLSVEMINIRARKRRGAPVKLHNTRPD